MFCTDVLSEGLSRVQLKGFFTGLKGVGAGWQTIMALIHHTELGGW